MRAAWSPAGMSTGEKTREDKKSHGDLVAGSLSRVVSRAYKPVSRWGNLCG